MTTIDAIKAVAEEIITDAAQFRADFGTNHHLAEHQWTEAWSKLTATAKEAEVEHGLLTGADLAELCNIAARLHNAIYGVNATVAVCWLADDQEGESVEVDYAEAERGYMECYMVRDLYPERDELYAKRIDRGSDLMHLLADMVHIPAGMDDQDGDRETLYLTWTK